MAKTADDLLVAPDSAPLSPEDRRILAQVEDSLAAGVEVYGWSRLAVTGAILGAFQGVVFGLGDAALETEDVLFLCTDGLTEARAGSEQFGEDRLVSLLSSVGGSAPDDVVTEVVSEVLSFSGSHLRDDLAILALRQA